MPIRVEGEVSNPRQFSYDDLCSLPDQVAEIATLVPGREGSGVRLRAILSAAGVHPDAAHLTLTSSDGHFSASVPLAAVEDAVVAYRLGDAPIPDAKGGPVRFYIPNVAECAIGGVDACANVKHLGVITIGKAPGADTRPTTEAAHAALHKQG